MSVESEILRIQHNIANSYAAVSEKGGEVPLQPTSANLPAAINTIPGSGGGGVPKGTIVIWSGTSEDIPSGWALCDGQDGRPDLRDKFVLGAGTAHAVGATGGEETHTLTLDEMPSHYHGVGFVYESAQRYSTGNSVSAVRNMTLDHFNNGDTSTVGSSQPHNNMPPYYALCYIIKTEEDSGSGGGAGGESAGEIYSTEETRIGTWIDGKPLYRKVFQATTPSAQEAAVLSLDATYEAKMLEGYIRPNSANAWVPATGPWSDLYVMCDTNEIYLYATSTNYRNTLILIAVKYTKTTDAPTISTAEIVGAYLDGSPEEDLNALAEAAKQSLLE